jgi:hypothetical protein
MAEQPEKRMKWVIGGIVIVVLASLWPLFSPGNDYSLAGLAGLSSTTAAEQPVSPPAQADGALQVETGVYLLGVGDLDTSTGQYSMDFYLNFLCNRPCQDIDFDIMNATEAPEKDNQTSDEDGDRSQSWRVRANLRTQLDLQDYPFDRHTLPIIIEDKHKPINELVYIPSARLSEVENEVLVSGWELTKHPDGSPHWSAIAQKHVYTVFDNEAYSRYIFMVEIYHPWYASFMKTLFAAIVIVGVGMLSFLMRHDEVTERLALTSSTLVGSILYHLTITSTIPPVGYLTFADKFMIVNYIVVGAALMVTVMLMYYSHGTGPNSDQDARRLHRWTSWVVPLSWVVLMVLITITQFAL